MLQAHHDGVVDVTIRPEIAGESAWSAEITAPDGEVLTLPETTATEQVITIEHPQLWWPERAGQTAAVPRDGSSGDGRYAYMAYWSAHDDRQP